jgi:hypothetical protein
MAPTSNPVDGTAIGALDRLIEVDLFSILTRRTKWHFSS